MDRLRCFGRTVIEGESERTRRLRSRKHLALLVYLTAHRGRTYPRERVASLFWDTEPRLARHSLSQALYDITQKVAGARLNRSATEVGMAEGGLAYEADEFAAAIRENDLARAVDLYTGSFVPDLETAGSHDFERWVEDERHRLRRIAEMALFRYVRECDDDAQWGEMCLAAHRLLKMNPLNEEAHRALMRGLWLKGDQAAAVNHFEEYAPGLERELPGGLSEKTLQLVARIRSSRPRATGMAVREIPRPEMVGRKEEFEALKRALRDVRDGTARLVRVHGEAGMGKTRLLEEFRDVTTLEEVTVLESRCYAAESEVPYSPVIDALRPIASSRAGRSGDGETFYQLGHLFPRLFERPDEKEDAFGEPEAGRRRLFEEVAALLRGALADRPLVWLVEDFHWIDASSAALIHYLVRRLERHPLLMVLTVREHEGVCEAARDFIESGDLTRPGPVDLTLSALGEQETLKLLTSLGDTVSTDSDTASRIHSLAGGNPFFALELLRAADPDPPARDYGAQSQSADLITRDLRNVLSRRLRGLSPKALRILESVAVAGRHATPRVVAEVAGLEPPELAEEAADLYRRDLLRDAAGRLEFLHDITREFVYANMGQLPQAAMHLAVAERLAETRDDVGAGTLAQHFERGGDQSRAFEYALRAAKEAEARHAHEEAIRMAKRALHQHSDPGPSIAARQILVDSCLAAGRFQAAREHGRDLLSMPALSRPHRIDAILNYAKACAECFDWVETIQATNRIVNQVDEGAGPADVKSVLRALQLRLKVAMRHQDMDEMTVTAAAIERIRKNSAYSLGPSASVLASTSLAAYSLINSSVREAREVLTDVADQVDDATPDQHFRWHLLMGAASGRQARWDEAEYHFSRATALAIERNAITDILLALSNRMAIELSTGNWDSIQSCVERIEAIYQTVPENTYWRLEPFINLAEAHLMAGRPRASQETLDRLRDDIFPFLPQSAKIESEPNLLILEILVALQTGLRSVVAENWEKVRALSHDVIVLTQTQEKVAWLNSVRIAADSPDQAAKYLAKTAEQIKSKSVPDYHQLKCLAALYSGVDDLPQSGHEALVELREVGMSWFGRFARRWLWQVHEAYGLENIKNDMGG